MRTTLTLDKDVAAMLERVRKSKKQPLKVVVNTALRQGLREINEPRKSTKPYRTRAVSLGACWIGSLDNVAEALAITEGESFR